MRALRGIYERLRCMSSSIVYCVSYHTCCIIVTSINLRSCDTIIDADWSVPSLMTESSELLLGKTLIILCILGGYYHVLWFIEWILLVKLVTYNKYRVVIIRGGCTHLGTLGGRAPYATCVLCTTSSNNNLGTFCIVILWPRHNSCKKGCVWKCAISACLTWCFLQVIG